MPRFLFILLICVLSVSALAQTLVYSHLSHKRDYGMNAPMVDSDYQYVSTTVANADVSVPVSTDPTPSPSPFPPGYPGYPPHYEPVKDQWSPAMTILVVTSILGSVGTLITLIITTLTKSRLEIMRESGNKRDVKVEEVHKEMQKNTEATNKVVEAVDQAKQRVEEVEKKLPIKQSETE